MNDLARQSLIDLVQQYGPAVGDDPRRLLFLLSRYKFVAKLLGGDAGAESFNKGLLNALGEKGFDGLDLTRPVVGYVLVPAEPDGMVAVVALPVTTEKDFVAFVGRLLEGTPPVAKANKLANGAAPPASTNAATTKIMAITTSVVVTPSATGLTLVHARSPAYGRTRMTRTAAPRPPAWAAIRPRTASPTGI